MFYTLVYVLSRILSRILFKLEVTGLENIPEQGPFILVSNHRSNLDPPLIAVSTKRRLYFLAKAELFENRINATMLKWLHCIMIDRNGVGKSALKKARLELSRGQGLLVFPEGTRSLDAKLKPGKPGISAFAFDAHPLIIPTFIDGTEKAMPRGSSSIRLAKVKVIFGKPFKADRLTDKRERKKAYQHFIDKVMREILTLEKAQT